MRAGLLLAIPLLSGCFLTSSGPKSTTDETPKEFRETRIHVPPTSDVYPYAAPAQAKPGEWARYRVTENGGVREITIGVRERAKDQAWVEIVEEDEVRRASARLVASDGTVVRAFYREIPRNGTASPVMPQELKQLSDPIPPSMTERSRSSEDSDVKIGSRTIRATVVRVDFEDLAGVTASEEWVWSAEVPRLFAGADPGGLVRKKTASQQVELLDFGADYKPLVDLPR